MRQVRDRHGDRKLITDHVKDSVKAVLIFYYVGNIVLDISGISTKVSYDNTWRSHFCSLIGNINLNRRTKNTHKMGMGNFKESAGMLKNTL